MNLRIVLCCCLTSCTVFALTNSAVGQVWLEAPILEFSDDDRFGDYEPKDLDEVAAESHAGAEGPLLVAQSNDWIQPPGQIVQQQPPSSPRPGAGPAPTPELKSTLTAPPPPSSLSPAPPLNNVSPPVVIEYGYPTPMAPPPQRTCPPWRPCGPDESFGGNWLFKQGFAGADYRPACANHDACLMSGCYSRKACDRMFLADMDTACNCSAFPILCRINARKCYLGVRLFGWLYY